MKVVHKILQLLELFADGKEYSFTAVIEMTGLSRSNASHLLSALVEEGVLSRSGRGIYRRSEGMFRLSGRDLFAEFRRIKKKHGTWVLVEVESADGDLVNVIL